MITITIREIDGLVTVESDAPYQSSGLGLGVRVAGILELAKAGLIAGRWKIMDEPLRMETGFRPGEGQ